jgi:hypothetical protein
MTCTPAQVSIESDYATQILPQMFKLLHSSSLHGERVGSSMLG